MCKVCDRLNQWVCVCGSINRVGSKCEECGSMRTGEEVGVVVYLEDERPNRATRRGSPIRRRW